MYPSQLATSLLVVLVVTSIGGVLVYQRGRVRRWGYALVLACAALSMMSWTGYGDFQTVFIDAPAASPEQGSARPKVKRHRAFHFHDFFHYYLGAKYFREVGYLHLYDCVALADREVADEINVTPRISGWVRNLEDVLTDKSHEAAVADCTTEARPKFSEERWRSFKADLRELQRLVTDDQWPNVVFDAGFNPPPSWVVVGTAFANTIPLRAYMVATALDLVLLVVAFLAFRSAFGATTAAIAAAFFGASFVSHYSWNGGSFLRFTWFFAIVLSLAAMKRRRWALAGALLGAATCDRLFPAAFAFSAMVPIAARAVRSPSDRVILRRFGGGFAATALVLVVASFVVFGASPWGVFWSRIGRHGDVYYVLHIGLKKVLTFREWVFTNNNFIGHEGLMRFRDWNLRLRDSWASMRALVVPLQLVTVASVVAAGIGRRAYEAAMLGAILVFALSMPANYYYAVVTPIPALLFRAAVEARTREARTKSYLAFVAFSAFWTYQIIAALVTPGAVVYCFWICLALALFFVVWMAAWVEPSKIRALYRR